MCLLSSKRSRLSFKDIDVCRELRELRICKAALHLLVQLLFPPSQLCFFLYFLDVELHCFGLGSEEERRLFSIFNVRY